MVTFRTVVLGLALTLGAVGCTTTTETSDGEASAQDLTQAADGVRIVRAYYAATKTKDPAAALEPIIADDAVLSAPSVKLLKGTPEVKGKDAFIKAVAGGSFLIGGAMIRDVIPQGDLVVSRIDLPLPNGDVLTQVEFFKIRDGKIERLDSYYDALRFIEALPAIALDRVKHALGM